MVKVRHIFFYKKTLAGDDFMHLLLPSLLYAVVQFIWGLADNIIAGNMLGTSALTSITLCKPYLSFIAFINMLIVPGTAVLSSLSVGKEERHKANQFFGQGIIMAAVLGVVFFIGSLIFKQSLFKVFNVPADILNNTEQYFNYLLIYPLFMFYPVLFTAVINDGGKKWCTISGIVMFVSKIALSLVLCYYIGIKGLSMSTMLSIALACVVLLFQFAEKNNPLKFIFHFSWKDAAKVLKEGFQDALLFYLFIAIFLFFFNWFLLKYFDAGAVVIFTIIVNIQALMIAVYDGLIQTIQPIITIYRGEDNLLGINKTMQVSVLVSTLITLSLIIAIVLFSNYIPLAFGVSDLKLCSEAARAVRIYVPCTLFFVWGMTLSGYLDKTEHFIFALIIMVAMLFLFNIPLSFFFGAHKMLNGIWTAMSVSISVGMLLGLYILYLYANKRREVFPWLLDKNKLCNQASFDVTGTKENVKVLMDKVEDELIRRGVEQKKILKVLLMLEETYMLNFDKTKKDKKYYVECTLLFKEKLLMYVRSNGVYSDATDTNAMPDSLRQYLSSMIVSSQKGSRFSLSVGDNRTIYEF